MIRDRRKSYNDAIERLHIISNNIFPHNVKKPKRPKIKPPDRNEPEPEPMKELSVQLRRLNTDEIARATAGRPMHSTEPPIESTGRASNATILFENEALDITLCAPETEHADDGSSNGGFVESPADDGATRSSPVAKRRRIDEASSETLAAAMDTNLATTKSPKGHESNTTLPLTEQSIHDHNRNGAQLADSGFGAGLNSTASIAIDADKQSSGESKGSSIRRNGSSATFIVSDADLTIHERPCVTTPDSVANRQSNAQSATESCEKLPQSEQNNSDDDEFECKGYTYMEIPMKTSPASSASGSQSHSADLERFCVSPNGAGSEPDDARSKTLATPQSSMSSQRNIQSRELTRNRSAVLNSQSTTFPSTPNKAGDRPAPLRHCRSVSTGTRLSDVQTTRNSATSGSTMQTHALARTRVTIFSSESSATNCRSTVPLRNVSVIQCTRTGSLGTMAGGRPESLAGTIDPKASEGTNISKEIQEIIDSMDADGLLDDGLGRAPSLGEPNEGGREHGAGSQPRDRSGATSQPLDGPELADNASVADSLIVNIPRQSQIVPDTQKSESDVSEVQRQSGVKNACTGAQIASPRTNTQIASPGHVNANDSDSGSSTAAHDGDEYADSAVGITNESSTTTRASMRFRVNLLRHSASKTCSIGEPQRSTESLNLDPPTATQVDKSNWLLHRSCSNDSVETSVPPRSTSTAKKPKPRVKCFPMSSRIVYSNFVDISPVKLAVNHFNDCDRNIAFHLLGKFQRFEYLNSNFNGTLFTTAPLKRLLMQYLNVNKDNIQVLNYNEQLAIDHIGITAIEVPNYPGGAIFLIENLVTRDAILHVGDHRLPPDFDDNSKLSNSEVHYIYFSPSIQSQVIYRFPADDDRYLDLMSVCQNFMIRNQVAGLRGMIVIGAFEIGMEFLLLRLVNVFGPMIWMNELRKRFLRYLQIGKCENTDHIIQPLVKRLATDSSTATVHVLDVHNINRDYLSSYLNQEKHGHFTVLLAIRPRGADFHAQTIYCEGSIEIIDVPNPLVGDIEEYDRFVGMTIEKQQQSLQHA